MKVRSAALHLPRLFAWAGCVALAAPACAHLGGAYASVEADRAHFGARLQATPTATHTVHALTLANGANTITSGPDSRPTRAAAAPAHPPAARTLRPHPDPTC